MLMLYAAAICCIFSSVKAETTMAPEGNHTHHHHESTENDDLSFRFDGQTNMLLVHTGTKCYIWTITHKEHASVHTDDGLRAIELRVMGDIDKALFTVVNKNILASSIVHGCDFVEGKILYGLAERGGRHRRLYVNTFLEDIRMNRGR